MFLLQFLIIVLAFYPVLYICIIYRMSPSHKSNYILVILVVLVYTNINSFLVSHHISFSSIEHYYQRVLVLLSIFLFIPNERRISEGCYESTQQMPAAECLLMDHSKGQTQRQFLSQKRSWCCPPHSLTCLVFIWQTDESVSPFSKGLYVIRGKDSAKEKKNLQFYKTGADEMPRWFTSKVLAIFKRQLRNPAVLWTWEAGSSTCTNSARHMSKSEIIWLMLAESLRVQ